MLTRLRLLCCDVDGVLTDGKYNISDNGVVMKSFNTKDFHGFSKLQDLGVLIAIVTRSSDQCIAKEIERLPGRAKINLVCLTNVESKKDAILTLMKIRTDVMYWHQVAYIGDDDNDLESMKESAFSACPYDALPYIKSQCNYIADKKGGEGAVREIIEYLFSWKEKGILQIG